MQKPAWKTAAIVGAAMGAMTVLVSLLSDGFSPENTVNGAKLIGGAVAGGLFGLILGALLDVLSRLFKRPE